MPLPTNLTTNEVKNSAGAEVEFLRAYANERMLEFMMNGEPPHLPCRINFAHQEQGSGLKRVRRSRLSVSYTTLGAVDSTVAVPCRAYTVLEIPVGNLTALTVPTVAMAMLQSLTSTTGAATTVLFDGTGYGAAALINGTL